MNKCIVTRAKSTQKTKSIKYTIKLKLIKIININGGWQWSFWAGMRALDIVTRKHWHIHVIGQRKQSFLLRRKRSMFRNTKKVNIVQEHQKIKSFSLQELTKQNKGRTKETQCKGRTILNHRQIRPRKKNQYFAFSESKNKVFLRKNRSFRRNNEHAVKKQKTEIKKNTYKCKKR